MELDPIEIGYYINQLTLSLSHFGFPQQDSSDLNTQWNAAFNYACGLRVNGQLESIRSDETCPEAVDGNCDLYQDFVSSGVITGTGTALPSDFVASTVAGATATPSSGIHTTTSTSSPAPTSATTSTPTALLGGGAIAGIVIGGGALTFAFVLALVFLIKKMNRRAPLAYEPTNPAAKSHPHTGYLSGQTLHAWNGPGPTIAEMESKVGGPELRNPSSLEPRTHMSIE